MIDWKRYEDELAAARSARIAADVVVAARRSHRHQFLAAVALAGGAVALLLVHLRRAPTRRRVYQVAATVRVPSSTARWPVHRS